MSKVRGWLHKIDIRSILNKHENSELPVLAKELAEYLRNTGLFITDDDFDIEVMIEYMEICDDVEEFDSYLDEIYDYADAHRIWVSGN